MHARLVQSMTGCGIGLYVVCTHSWRAKGCERTSPQLAMCMGSVYKLSMTHLLCTAVII